MVTTAAGTTSSPWCAPTTGSSQFCNDEPRTSRRPENTEPTASRIIGPVITTGDSCGWVSGFQRRSPKKVISMTRVM